MWRGRPAQARLEGQDRPRPVLPQRLSEDPASHGKPGGEFTGIPQLDVVEACRPLTLGTPVVGRCDALELLLPCCVPAVPWQKRQGDREAAGLAVLAGSQPAGSCGPPVGDPEPFPAARALGRACCQPLPVLDPFLGCAPRGAGRRQTDGGRGRRARAGVGGCPAPGRPGGYVTSARASQAGTSFGPVFQA